MKEIKFDLKKKPPIGLMPQNLHRSERFCDVCKAIARYYDANLPIPIKWVEEYNEYLESFTNSPKK